MFFMAVNQAFGMIGPVLGSFPTERGIIIRERMARSYRLSAYYLAKVRPPDWKPLICVEKSGSGDGNASLNGPRFVISGRDVEIFLQDHCGL
jgi:hypothetical protein